VSETSSDRGTTGTKDESTSQEVTSSNATESEDEDGPLRMTVKWFKEFFKKEWRTYYRTFELNEKLYLHFKGFNKIENMHLFPELKCLYFEGNGLRQMTGLEACVEMRTLNVHENIIQKMEGMQTMTDLRTLQLSDNCISKIEGLTMCTKLVTIYLKQNNVGRNGISDLYGLLECPSLEVVDLQANEIHDEACLEEIFMKMPKLKVLYLFKNECTKKIKNYRKTVINNIPTLNYLDDRPVFVDDRRTAEAFATGGVEAEREERKKMKEEKAKAHEDYHKNFK
jgi:dynein assembly factor 1, axonemal